MKKLMDRSKKLLVGLLALFAFYSLAGFFLVPYLIKTVAAEKLTVLLRRETSVEKAYFNPYSFNLSVKGFKVMEPGGAEVFASFDELKVNLQGRSLVKGGLTVKKLVLDKPYVRAVHNRDLSYNFSDLIPKGGQEEKTPPKYPLKFSFNNISVTNGSVDFIDQPKGKSHTVREMNIEIPFISSIPSEVEIFVKPSFSAKVNDTLFALGGESKPFADSNETSLDIKLDGVQLPEYLAYSPVPLNFRMPSGKLLADLALTYVQYGNRAPELALKGSLGFRDIELQDENGQRITKLPSVDINIASIDVFSQKARILSVKLSRPDISLVRKADGSMNLLSLVPGKQDKIRFSSEKEREGAFTLEIDTLDIDKARLSFSDLTRKARFRRSLEPVDISVKGFTTSAEKPARMRFDYRNPSGEGILAEGSLSMNPVEAEIVLKAEALDISSFQPYLDGVANVIVTKGRASANGAVSAGVGPEGVRLSYKGNALLSGVSAIDRQHGGDFIKWNSLALEGIEFGLAPMSVIVKSVELSDFHSNVIVNRDGRLNLADVAARKTQRELGTVARPAPETGQPAYVRIDSVAFRDGRVDALDLHIEPVFFTSVVDLSGNVKGLYLNGSNLAEVTLSGKIDKYAPFEAAGKINPKKDGLFIDMAVKLTGYDLSSLTPYSGRYIGYGIEKGKIFLDLSYLIEKRKLKAKNEVLIDQITLGEKVESPQATTLPVSFAIKLLKDKRGQIRLDVPLSGSLDDPEFSVAGQIVQAVVNLLERAVKAPFAFVGGLFGEGEDLGYLEFAPGSKALTKASVKKLDALITALYERPGLNLDIEGFAGSEEDSKSLSERKFMRALKVEKSMEAAQDGRSSVPVDDIVIEKDEFEKYLFLAYKKADFPKEKNFLGLVKKLPTPELERLLRKHTAVTDDDLRALAASRSNAVQDYILASGKVEASRVFMHWPRDLKPEKKKSLSDSRVEFKLE